MANLARLPMPVMDAWEWQEAGVCRDAPTEQFFSPESERGPRRRAREAAAKAFCARCPVIDRCLQHALNVQEPYGVWGGLNTRERQDLATRRAVG